MGLLDLSMFIHSQTNGFAVPRYPSHLKGHLKIKRHLVGQLSIAWRLALAYTYSKKNLETNLHVLPGINASFTRFTPDAETRPTTGVGSNT